MTYKKVGVTPYGRRVKFLEINAKDQDNQTVDFIRIQDGKTIDAQRFINKLKNKYGFTLLSDNEEPEEKVEVKEKSVLDKDMTW